MKKIGQRKVITAILMLTMLCSVCTVTAAADASKTTKSSLHSRGSIRYQEGKESVVIDSADLYTLADRLDLFKLRTVEQLGAIGTYLSREAGGTQLSSKEDIYVMHREPSSFDAADPLSLSFETILEGIAASQSISADPADYGMKSGAVLYKGADGKLYTESQEDCEQICIQAATAENLSAGTAAWVNGELILGTGGDNKAYFEKGEGSGSIEDDTEALKRVESISIGNASKIYVAPEDMTDVILVFWGVKKHQLTFASEEVIPYKEIYHKVRSKQREGFTDVVCTMYFIPKLPKGTGVNVPADSGDYKSYLVRVKDPNHKGGQITTEDISGSNYFAKTDMKDVLLLQRSDNSDPVPAFEPAPGKPIVGFKKIAEFRHQYGFGYPQGNGIAGSLVHYYSLYYIPNMPAGTTISKHKGGVLFY